VKKKPEKPKKTKNFRKKNHEKWIFEAFGVWKVEKRE
jgi:hypothetical protein